MTAQQVANAIRGDAFWSVNKAVARAAGLELAVFVSALLSKWQYWKERGQLDDRGGFFWVSEDIQAELGIFEGVVKRLTREVQEQGLATVEKRGVPAKNYWYINFDALAKILDVSPPPAGEIDAFSRQNLLTSEAETDPTGEVKTEPTGQAETDPTITKNKRQRTKNNIPALPPGVYPAVCDMFAKGYESLEGGNKLSWEGKGKAYGDAVKTIIRQAQSVCGKDAEPEKLVAEIKARGRAVLVAITEARMAFERGEKSSSRYMADRKFTPLTLEYLWNEYPPATNAAPKEFYQPPARQEIPPEELERHRQAGGV